MANRTIDDFSAVVSPATTDTLIVTQAAVAKKETLAQVDTLLSATAKTLTNKTLTSPVINTGVSGTAIDTDGTLAANSDTLLPSQKAVKTAISQLQAGYFYGLEISHAADTEHDITVAAGKSRDATDAASLVLASAITKRFDAEWVVGSTNGGFAVGESLPASGTIHLWLIKRSDTGVVDVLANNHATTALAPTLPANYDYKRRIFSLRTDSSNNIINGDQWGTGVLRRFMYDTPILDVSNATPGTNANTTALSVPAGIVVGAIMNVTGVGGAFTYVSSLANTDMDPSTSAAPLGSAYTINPVAFVFTNTSSQIRYRCDANAAMYIATLGWEDSI